MRCAEFKCDILMFFSGFAYLKQTENIRILSTYNVKWQFFCFNQISQFEFTALEPRISTFVIYKAIYSMPNKVVASEQEIALYMW